MYNIQSSPSATTAIIATKYPCQRSSFVYHINTIYIPYTVNCKLEILSANYMRYVIATYTLVQ